MAKKSNKTEHVLRLITKNEDLSQEDDFFDMEQDIYENGTSAIRKAVQSGSDAAQPKQQVTAEPAAAPVQPPPPVAKAQQQESSLVRAFREQENSQPAVPEQSGGLVNIAEILAREKIALVMERMKVCTCRTCCNDVLALTLNALPTKYVTANTGEQYFQRSAYKDRYETDILAALTKACVRVKASPRH